DASLHGTGIGKAFHLKTNVPVVAYQMLPYGGGSARVTGSTLLVPTNAWDVNYVVADAYSAPPMITEPRAGPTTVIIAGTEGTNVTVKPSRTIVSGTGVAGTPAGAAPGRGGAVGQAGGGHRGLDADGPPALELARRQRRADAPAGEGPRQRVRRRALPQPERHRGVGSLAHRGRRERHEAHVRPGRADGLLRERLGAAARR